MAKFKSRSGGHVRIYRFGAPILDIDEGGTYETSDSDEIKALRDSPEVQETRSKSNDDEDKDDDA
jgi:hypothetical protein